MNIKMVAFDVGDTLYRVGHPELLSACWKEEQKVLIKHKLKFTSAQYSKAAERAWRESQKSKYKHNSLSVPLLVQKFLGYAPDETIANEMADSFTKIAEKYKVKRKHIIRNALKTLHSVRRKGIKLGIISDAKTSWAREWFKDLGIYDYFSIIVLSNEVGGKKASGIPFKKFLDIAKKDFKLKPNEIAFVGDLSVDMDAKKYGMATVLFNPLNNEYNHFESKPDFIVKDLKDVEKVLMI